MTCEVGPEKELNKGARTRMGKTKMNSVLTLLDLPAWGRNFCLKTANCVQSLVQLRVFK